jgi:hypothetical protein
MASIISAGTTSGTSLNLSADTSGVLQLATNGTTTAVTIDTSQNVGIGTSSPATKAEISGTAAAQNLALRITNTATDGYSTLQLGGGGDGGVFRNGSTQTAYGGASSLNLITVGAHAIGLATGNTIRAIIPAAGGVQAVTCVSVGNATPASTGAGITFPATQSASSDANTLDDYEEGTWTPVVSDATSGGNLATMSTDGTTNGVYTKIGNIVYWRFSAILTSKASMSAGNTVFFQGFPFQSAAITGSWYNPNPTIIRNITFTDYVQFNQAGNTTYGYLRENVSNATGDDILVSDFTNSAAIQASGFYRVA